MIEEGFLPECLDNTTQYGLKSKKLVRFNHIHAFKDKLKPYNYDFNVNLLPYHIHADRPIL